MRKICVLALFFALPALLLSQSKESPQAKPLVFTHVTLDAPSERCNSAPLPVAFADKAYSHVVSLAAFGVRSASTEGEWRAIGYVRDQFRKIGLKTVVEDFEFDSYEIEDMELRLGDSTYRPVSLGFNPYAGNYRFEGLAKLVDPQDLSSGGTLPDIENGYVITTQPANYFQLMFRKPKLIVYVDPSDFGRLKATADRRFELTIKGRLARYKSANVIAQTAGRASASREIIVSAHLDAYRTSPGADDNASGVGVLIELSRHFKSIEQRLGARIKFVAFGAEELGAVGSRAYVQRHAEELGKCALNINLDTIGGPRGPFVETLGGVAGIPERVGKSQFPPDLLDKAWEGVNSNWRLLDLRVISVLQVSNHPEWLKSLIQESADALGIKIIHAGNMGGDELVFTQAGVVATCVGYSGNAVHGPGDTVEQVRKENLGKVGNLVACVVERVATESAAKQRKTR